MVQIGDSIIPALIFKTLWKPDIAAAVDERALLRLAHGDRRGGRGCRRRDNGGHRGRLHLLTGSAAAKQHAADQKRQGTDACCRIIIFLINYIKNCFLFKIISII